MCLRISRETIFTRSLAYLAPWCLVSGVPLDLLWTPVHVRCPLE